MGSEPSWRSPLSAPVGRREAGVLQPIPMTKPFGKAKNTPQASLKQLLSRRQPVYMKPIVLPRPDPSRTPLSGTQPQIQHPLPSYSLPPALPSLAFSPPRFLLCSRLGLECITVMIDVVHVIWHYGYDSGEQIMGSWWWWSLLGP